ncbi:hypothetical protein ABZ383_35900 [Streptomyces sp. NPDC005900]|uniref:hypothetical protein n=1 Tax=unclassified Streptomyces TaxID=2593676 RepID=UPI0033D3E57D
MELSKRTKNALGVAALYVFAVLVVRFADGGTSWWTALLFGLVVTPLALWAAWLRRRMIERGAEYGRRRLRPWPEERRRA